MSVSLFETKFLNKFTVSLKSGSKRTCCVSKQLQFSQKIVKIILLFSWEIHCTKTTNYLIHIRISFENLKIKLILTQRKIPLKKHCFENSLNFIYFLNCYINIDDNDLTSTHPLIPFNGIFSILYKIDGIWKSRRIQ